MANLNRVLLIGRLTRDPEVRQTPGGVSVCKFGMATNRNYTVNGEKKEETCYVDLTAWGKSGEILNQYVSRGSQLFVEGRLQFSQWEDKNGGGKRSKIEVVVENFQFLGSGGRRESGGGEADLDPADFGFNTESRPSGGASSSSSGGGENAAAEDDLPF